MRLPLHMVLEIVAHSYAAYPDECCGMIGAKNGAATTLYRGTNEASNSVLYKYDPLTQITQMQGMEENGEELMVIYHSHPHSKAFPSLIDLGDAAYDACYVICSLRDLDYPDIRGFWMEDNERIYIEPLEVVQPGVALQSTKL